MEFDKCFLIIGSQSGIGFNGGALKTFLNILLGRYFTVSNRSAREEEETPNRIPRGRLLRVINTVFIGLYFIHLILEGSQSLKLGPAYNISSIKLMNCQMEAGIYLLFKLNRAGCCDGVALLVD